MTSATATEGGPDGAAAGGPLAGLRVVEIGRYIAAPFAGVLLADLGADVIKVEDPRDGGDPMRAWQGSDGASPQFAAYNRGKRSIALDLTRPEDRTTLGTLLDGADAVIENFRPGVMERLGFGWDALHARNPGLILVSITGFGTTGPLAGRPAFDTVVSAMSGLYSLLLDPEDPLPVGPAFSDVLSGMFATLGLLAALRARDATGEGQLVEASMLASILGLLTEPATAFLATGRIPTWNTRQRRAQAYAAIDSEGLPFVVHLSVPERFWTALTDVMERPELREDPRFSSRQARYENYAALDREIKATMRLRTREEWSARLAARDVPHAAVLRIDEVVEDEQVVAMGLRVDVPGRDGSVLRTIRPPLVMSATPPSVGGPPPRLDEHGDRIRRAPADAWRDDEQEDPDA